MTSINMYKVGEFVYFEASASVPYQIRQIKQLNKLKHREVFMSNHLENLPATHIRGKCSVVLHNGSESCQNYLAKEDSFFYQLTYDPIQKTLQADRGTVRQGEQFQVEIPDFVPPSLYPASCNDESDDCDESREQLMWRPVDDEQQLTESQLRSYLVSAHSLAILGRSMHPHSLLRHPTLHLAAAAAHRDSVKQVAMDTLHSNNYNPTRALNALALSSSAPSPLLLNGDQMESWSVSEGNLFEEALAKYGKCFVDIQADFLPWKHVKNLVEFYYLWKTTDNYIKQKRFKANSQLGQQQHLRQVYIPNYTKPNPAVLYHDDTTSAANSGDAVRHSPLSGCDCCSALKSNPWYALDTSSSSSSSLPWKVCTDCWTYWKRYGQLEMTKNTDEKVDGIEQQTGELNGVETHHNNNENDNSSSPVVPSSLLEADCPNTVDLVLTEGVGNNKRIVGLTAAKAKPGLCFSFWAPPILRSTRRRLACDDNVVRIRRPFKPIASLARLLAEVRSNGSDLSVEEKNAVDVIADSRRHRRRRVNLDDLVVGLKSTLSTSIDDMCGGDLDVGKISTPVLECVDKKDDDNIDKSSHSPSQTSPQPSPSVAASPTSCGGAKRRKFDHSPPGSPRTEKSSTNLSPPLSSSPRQVDDEKQPTPPASVVNGSSSGGPKKKKPRTDVTGGDGPVTLLYKASKLFRQRRRKLLTQLQSRRLSRRPWLPASHVTSLNEKDGNEPTAPTPTQSPPPP